MDNDKKKETAVSEAKQEILKQRALVMYEDLTELKEDAPLPVLAHDCHVEYRKQLGEMTMRETDMKRRIEKLMAAIEEVRGLKVSLSLFLSLPLSLLSLSLSQPHESLSTPTPLNQLNLSPFVPAAVFPSHHTVNCHNVDVYGIEASAVAPEVMHLSHLKVRLQRKLRGHYGKIYGLDFARNDLCADNERK